MKKLLLVALAVPAYISALAQCETNYGKLVINEFMARNIVIADEFGEFDDWVEVMNGGEESVNIGGYFLSDNHGNRTRYTFPDLVLDPGDYVVVWCDGQPFQGEFHTEFGLQGTVGERVVLSNPDTVVIDHVDYGPVDNLQSLSRFPDGYGPFRFATPTPAAGNIEGGFGSANSGRGLVINEFLARNTSSGMDEYGNYFDWIELYNNRDIPLNLGGYFLSDNSNSPEKYEFPEPTILASGGYIVVFNAGIDGVSDIWPLHTPYNLSGDGEYVHLYNKDTVTIDFVWFGPQQQDISEGRFENGLGPIKCLEPTLGFSNDPGTVSISEYNLAEDFEFSVYPVPATDFVNVHLNDGTPGVMQLFSVLGNHVADYSYQGDGPHYIDLSGYNSGVYLLRIGNKTKRIIVR
jgi:hypothetical protein